MSLKQTKKIYIGLYKGINKFKNDLRAESEPDKILNYNMLEDSHSILNGLKNYFCHLLNVQGIGQTEIHTVDPSVSEPSSFKVSFAVEQLKRNLSNCG
jgi:hypothetical protein